jgi:ppGpp synthetase/RelA/SpoT-type nucleotidyltranferase
LARKLSPEDQDFLDVYASHVRGVIDPVEERVRAVFRDWKEEGYWSRYKEYDQVALPRPTQRTRTRIKRPESVLDKIERQPRDFPMGKSLASLEKMYDLLGARVVSYFPTHIKMVDTEIRSGRHFEVSPLESPRSYISTDTMVRIGLDPEAFKMKGIKPSGYASLHYFVRLSGGRRPNPWFELQVRTMLEEVWGEVEHQLAYKPEKQTEFSVSRQFRVISHYLAALDDHFDFLYDRLLYLQNRADPEPDDLLNAENFPKVLDRIEVMCEQDEIDALLDILQARGISTVADFQIRATTEVIERIRSGYAVSGSGHTPGAFFIVATIALLSRTPLMREVDEALRFNLAARDLTYRLRHEGRSGHGGDSING